MLDGAQAAAEGACEHTVDHTLQATLDRLQAHVLAGHAKLSQAHFRVAPFANGMVDATF